ncbi:hypothetical protein [Vibrio owensii]|uniref:hypothetical protein n=1 Tax=Vibrio owensii TaxID=696485 RepID=UPI0018F1FD60|nr:hypothetical protein [Vibrio owensii]
MFKLIPRVDAQTKPSLSLPKNLFDVQPLAKAVNYGASMFSDSRVEGVDGTLSQLIQLNKQQSLGAKLTEKCTTLPYSVSLLHVDAALPLSINPSRELVDFGYEHEERLGIKRSARERIYPDSGEGSQVYCCMSDGLLLRGFKSPDDVYSYFVALGASGISKPLMKFGVDVSRIGLVQFFKALCDLSKPEMKRLVDQIIKSESNFGVRYTNEYEVANLLHSSNSSVFSVVGAFIFNCYRVQPSHVVYVPVGVPYQLLSGSFVEVRVGTANVVEFHSGGQKYCPGDSFASIRLDASEEVFSDMRIFEGYALYEHKNFPCNLGLYQVSQRGVEFDVKSPELIVCVNGQLNAEGKGRLITLTGGECAFVLKSVGNCRLTGAGLVLRIGV